MSEVEQNTTKIETPATTGSETSLKKEPLPYVRGSSETTRSGSDNRGGYRGQNTNNTSGVAGTSHTGAPRPGGSRFDRNRPSRPGGFGGGDRPAGSRPSFGNRPGGGDRPGSFGPGRGRGGDKRKRDQNENDSNIESLVIEVRRVSRTVKGGKKMRFSALIVAGDRAGKIGFGLAKGLDFQDAVNKATKKAKDKMIKIDINSDGSIKYPINYKFKASIIYLKPAKSGTGLIAGGFLRPVLQLAGIQNIYSKLVGSNNKVVGVRAAFEALKECYRLQHTPGTPVLPVSLKTV